ncbi:MAG TPA: hypothetical protein VGE59_04800 [Patescibacteria group bacterium]
MEGIVSYPQWFAFWAFVGTGGALCFAGWILVGLTQLTLSCSRLGSAGSPPTKSQWILRVALLLFCVGLAINSWSNLRHFQSQNKTVRSRGPSFLFLQGIF